MAFTPIPEGSMPSPDEVLGQLQRESGEPTEGYITPDDIEFGWRAFLSALAHQGDHIATLTQQTTQAINRGDTLTAAMQGLLDGKATSPFDPSQTYAKGDVATHGGKLWLATQPSTGVTPSPTTPQWQQVSLPDMLDQIAQGVGGTPVSAFAQTTPSENSLPPIEPQGTLLLALDTGQWFKSNGSTWDRLGLDIPATASNLAAALLRTDGLDAIIDAIVGDQSVENYQSGTTYQPGDTALHGGDLWIANQQVTGVTPSGSAAEWSLLTLPDLLSKVKQALSQGAQAGNMPQPDDPADDGKVLTARGGAGVWETLAHLTAAQVVGVAPAWKSGSTYPARQVVEHNGQYWIARTDTAAGEEPGVDGKWRSLLLGDIWQRASEWSPPKPGDPADNGKILVAQDGDAHWVPAPSGGGGSTVTILEPAGDNAVSPTSTGLDAPTNLPQSPSVGDIVVNTTAGTAWVWGPSTQGGHDWLSFQRPYVFAIMGDPNAVAPADGDSPVALDSHGWITPCNTDHVSLWAGELLINVESGAMWVLDGDSWTWQPVGGVGGADDGLTIKMIHEDWALPGADTVPEGTVYVIRKTGQLVESVSRRASSDTYRWKGDLAYAADDSNIGTGEAYAVSGLAADGASGTLAVAKRGANFGVDSRDLLDGVGVGDVIYVEDDAGNRYGGAVTAVEDPGDQGSWPGFRTWTTDGAASTGTIPADAMVTVYVDGAAWERLTQDWMAPAPTRSQGDHNAVLTATGFGEAAWLAPGDPLYEMLKMGAFDPTDTTAGPPTAADKYGYVGIDGKTLSAATVLRVATYTKDGQGFDVTRELTPGTIVTISPVGTPTYLGNCGSFSASFRVTGAPTGVTGTQYLMDVPVEPYSITYWDGDFAGRFEEELVRTLCYNRVTLHIPKGEEVPDPPLTQLKQETTGYVFTSGAAYGPGEVWMQYHTANTPGNKDVVLAWETPYRGKDPSIKRVLYVDDAQDANGKANYFRDHLTDGYWYKVTNTLDAAERQVVSVLDSSTGTATPPHFVFSDQGWVEQAGGGSADVGDLPRVLNVEPTGSTTPATAHVVPPYAATWDVKDGDPFFLAFRQDRLTSGFDNTVSGFGTALSSDDPMSVAITNPDGSQGDTIPLQASDGTALSYKQVYELVHYSADYGPYDGVQAWPFWATYLGHYEGTGIRLDKVTSAVLADIPGEAANAYDYEITPHPSGPYGAVADVWEKAAAGHFTAKHETEGGHVPGATCVLGCKAALEKATGQRKIDGVTVDLALLKSDGTDLISTCSITGQSEFVRLDQVAKILVDPGRIKTSHAPQVGDILTIKADLDRLNPRPVQRYIVESVTPGGTDATAVDLRPIGASATNHATLGTPVRINWFPQAPPRIVTLTAAEYQALPAKDPDTLYVVKG